MIYELLSHTVTTITICKMDSVDISYKIGNYI